MKPSDLFWSSNSHTQNRETRLEKPFPKILNYPCLLFANVHTFG